MTTKQTTSRDRKYVPIARSERFDHGGCGVPILIHTETEKGHLVPRGKSDSGIDCEFVIRGRHCFAEVVESGIVMCMLRSNQSTSYLIVASLVSYHDTSQIFHGLIWYRDTLNRNPVYRHTRWLPVNETVITDSNNGLI